MVRSHDFDGFIAWIGRTRVAIDLDLVKTAFGSCFKSGETTKALRLFDATFPMVDPTVDRIVAYLKLTFIALAILGLLGGVAYLLSLAARFSG